MSRAAALAVFALLGVGLAVAHADGEAGLVIDFGDGNVVTFCVAFEGDGIRGDHLLSRAGMSVDAFRAGGPSVVCAINGHGCSDASSFNSCWCECPSGGADCTYWGFFTRDYDDTAWRYSARAFDLTTAGDGDMHAWKWGKGSLSSAPPPGQVTFEQVCGHPPQGSQAATATTPPQPTATSSSGAGTTAPPPTTETGVPPSPAGDPMTPAVGTLTVTPVFTPAGPSSTATPTAGNGDDVDDTDDDGLSVGLIAFAVLAAVLIAAISGAAYWRAHRGG